MLQSADESLYGCKIRRLGTVHLLTRSHVQFTFSALIRSRRRAEARHGCMKLNLPRFA